MTGDHAEEQGVQAAVRRHRRNSAFAEAEKVISFLLSDPGVQQARAQVEAAETRLGMELCARLQPFQDRYEQARARRRRGRAHPDLSGQARPLGTYLCPGRRSRDLDGGTALGLQQRGAADRVGGQRARRLVSAPGRAVALGLEWAAA